MSTSPAKFHIREVDTAVGDGEFIVAAFDSTLPYLASIGSHEQWGLTPFSERDGWAAETLQQVENAEIHRLTGQGDAALRIFIVEAEVPDEGDVGGLRADSAVIKSADGRQDLRPQIDPGQGKCVLPVGFAFVREDDIPKYILTQDHLNITDADRESCVYIEVMVAHHRVSSALRKGIGAALIGEIKESAKIANRRCLFVDGWAENDKQLIGFVPPLGLLPYFRDSRVENDYISAKLIMLVTTFDKVFKC